MPRILVVDDEPDMRTALRNVLASEGHQIDEAADGPAALKSLQEQPADLVLLDVRLPGMDGVQTLKRIKEVRRELPVVMLTGYGSEEIAEELFRLGASQYLQKPIDNLHLLAVVNTLLKVPASRPSSSPLRQALLQKIGVTPAAVPLKPPPSAPVRQPESTPARLRPGRTWKFALAGGVLLGAVAAVRLLWPPPAPPLLEERDYMLAGEHPSGLAWTEEGLYVSDWFSQSVCLYDQELKLVKTFKLPGVQAAGLAIGGGYVYVANLDRRTIEKRRADAELSLIVSVPSPGPSPAGLYHDGEYLWSADATSGKLYRHSLGEGLPVTASYPTPGKSPVGVGRDQASLWSADAETAKLFRHNSDGSLSVAESYSVTGFTPGQEPLSALAWHAGHLWLAVDGRNVLYKRPPRSLVKVAGPP